MRHPFPSCFVLAALGLVALTHLAHADLDVDDDRPMPGRDKVTPIRPGWCGGVKPYFPDSDGPPGTNAVRIGARQLSVRGFTDEALATVAAAACAYPDTPLVQQQVARWRQRHVNLTGLSEGRERELLAQMFRYASRGEDDNPGDRLRADRAGYCEHEAFRSIDVDDDDTLPRADRTNALAELGRTAGGCDRPTWESRSRTPVLASYWLDRDAAPPSEIARAAAVVHCLGRGLDRDARPDPEDPEVFLAYAVCGADARRLDPARAEAELADARYHDWARVHARETVARAVLLTEHLTAAYRGLAGQHPEVQQLAFDVPERTWKAWEAARATWKAEVDQALAYEDALVGTSKKARLGCSDSLHASLDRWAASRKVTTLAQARELSLDPIGHALIEKTILCDVHDHPEEYGAMAQNEAGLLSGRSFHGPRYAVFWAVTDVITKLAEDDESYPLEPGAGGPAVTRFKLPGAIDLRDDNQARGEISKVSKAGDQVVVTFKTVKATREVTECVSTGKFWGWGADGSPIYHSSCRVTGKVTETVSPAPIKVPAVVGRGLAKGQFGVFWVSGSSDDRPGFPIEVYADKRQQRLVVFRGVGLR